MQTLSELFGISNRFTTGMGTHYMILYIPEYKRAVNEGRVLTVPIEGKRSNDTIQIFGCDKLASFSESEERGKFYTFPHKLFSALTTHEMGYLSPYKEKFQDLTNEAFSAGLHQAWKNSMELEGRNISAWHTDEKSSLLTFDDLKQVFYVFPYGIIAGILLLLLEIFHYEFYARFSWQFFMKKFAWKAKKNTVKVRRIQVQPINVDESET